MDEPEDYDALNDETFGSAINDDWEGEHENLVLLDTNGNTSRKEKDDTDDGDMGDLGKMKSRFSFLFLDSLCLFHHKYMKLHIAF